jgi:hypothetical protein
MSDGIEAKVLRGKPSWDFLYIVLGFTLTIESTIVTMIDPLKFPWNVLLYVAIAGLTIRYFYTSGWLHDRLIGLKNKYESIPR